MSSQEDRPLEPQTIANIPGAQVKRPGGTVLAHQLSQFSLGSGRCTRTDNGAKKHQRGATGAAENPLARNSNMAFGQKTIGT